MAWAVVSDTRAGLAPICARSVSPPRRPGIAASTPPSSGGHSCAGSVFAALATALVSTILTVQGAIAPHWQWTLLPSIAATVTGLLATAASGAEHVGKEDVYASYEMAAGNPQGVGVTVLASVQRAFLENDQALQGKRRLTAATFGCLLLSALLIGGLNVGNQATLGSL